MTGGGSSELRSLRSDVERALEICGKHGRELVQLWELVGDLQAEVAELRADGAAAKPAPRSKAKPRRARDAAQAR